ncbi:MFS transporter [Zhihengliuella halotolerans]|uniref:MFS transporter n=1 Tax=Zhihengliuella halotolerans TaxID=370736 RepID=UPI000C7FC933|nr:MFS transporter [Zhihengliuella halotolerans]
MRTRAGRPAGPGLLAALLGAIAVGPLLLYGLSATSDLIIRDLGINAAQFGLLATACFACATVGNAALGRLADRRSDRTLMIAVFALAAVALGVAALADAFVVLLVAAGLSGLAQSFPNGVTNRILLQRVPAQQRIGWTGIKQSGVQVSQLVASLAFPALAVWIGWRGASALGVILALALMVLALRALASVPPLPAVGSALPHTSAATGGAAGQSDGVSVRRATRRTGPPFAVWALTVFGCLNGLGVQATNVYLPLFAVRELEFSLVAGGATAAVAGLVGVSARIGWGKVMARGASAPALLLVLALLALGAAGSFYAAGATGWSALLWVAVALHGASALGVSVVLMAALLRSIPAASMASASGIVTAGMFAGFTFGPLVMGSLISAAGGFETGWIAVGGVYAVCVGVAAYLLRRQRRAAAEGDGPHVGSAD